MSSQFYNIYRVFVNNDIVFEGKIKKIGGGGTKTAYQLEGTDNVVLLPNFIDGPWLVSIFDRICDEEVFMYNHLLSKNLIGLAVLHCYVQRIDTDMPAMIGLYAPSFSSFENKRAHILDKKDTITFKWIPPTIDSVQDWILVFNPLIEDLNLLLDSKVVPYGDSYNFLLAEKGSPYYSGSGKYAVRYFGFDFASKHHTLAHFRDLASEKKELVKLAIDEAIDYICGFVAQLPDDKVKEIKITLLDF